MFMALAGIGGLVAFVCNIIFLIQLFKRKGALMGIFGFFCSIYTYFWGWGNATELDQSADKMGLPYKTWMLVWTIGYIVLIVGQVLGGVA
jgi:hypothetical protein